MFRKDLWKKLELNTSRQICCHSTLWKADVQLNTVTFILARMSFICLFVLFLPDTDVFVTLLRYFVCCISQYKRLAQHWMTKTRSERRKHCELAVVGGAKNFRNAADPLPGGGQDRQNLISWRWSLPLPTDPVWWRSMHAISSYRGNRPIKKHTNKQTHKQTGRDYNTLRR